jgi:ubiquinone/menaquinone biosynthesis C-methylase UbiE
MKLLDHNRLSVLEFDLMAPLYDRITRLFNWAPPGKVFDAVTRASEEAPKKVLDVGTGTGILSEMFMKQAAGRDIHIVGIDLSSPMLQAFKDKGVTDSLIRCDAGKHHLPFRDSSFDTVVSSGVLDFIGTLDSLSAEMARVGRPGAIIAVTYLADKPGRGHTRSSVSGAQHKYSPDYVDRVFAEAGVDKLYDENFKAYSHLWGVKYGLYVGRVAPKFGNN